MICTTFRFVRAVLHELRWPKISLGVNGGQIMYDLTRPATKRSAGDRA